jgi:hypothetical protein
LRLAGPGLRAFETMADASGVVTVTHYAATHGAVLRATFELDTTIGTEAHHIEGEVRTFVRDVDPLPTRCGAAEPAR